MSELQAAHAALMVANEELVSKHQRLLDDSQHREDRFVEELELTKNRIRTQSGELKACKDIIDAANETIVLKVSAMFLKWSSTL